MAPLVVPTNAEIAKPDSSPGLILEAWAQGYMVGSLIIMAAITVSNMRRGAYYFSTKDTCILVSCWMPANEHMKEYYCTNSF